MPITAERVREIFSSLENSNGDAFFAHVADHVDWTVQGTHPMAGHYRSKTDFREHTLAKLSRILPQGPQLRVLNVLVSGDWATVELWSMATAKNGLRFDNGTAGSPGSHTARSWRCALTSTRHWCSGS